MCVFCVCVHACVRAYIHACNCAYVHACLHTCGCVHAYEHVCVGCDIHYNQPLYVRFSVPFWANTQVLGVSIVNSARYLIYFSAVCVTTVTDLVLCQVTALILPGLIRLAVGLPGVSFS